MNEKKICNLLVNRLIEEYKKIDVLNKTEIYVTKHSKFFVVEGQTSILSPINISNILKPFLEKITNDDEVLNFIDIVEYNKSPILDIKVDEVYDKKIKLNFENVSLSPAISDRYYGLSINTDKTYIVLSKYISNHIFRKNLCTSISINLNSKFLYTSNWSDINLKLSSQDCIVNLEWLESLILDLFPFELNQIISDLELEKFDFENEITKTMVYPWLKLDKISEMILV